VIENGDSPLRILEARVKEIPGPDFTKLTGQQTDLPIVCSVPEVRMLNSSAKTITEFILVVRDPTSKSSRGIVQSKVEIAQGQTFTTPRTSFVKSEMVSKAEKDGSIQARLTQPGMNSAKYWIQFAGRSDLFVTVARVTFRDGSTWEVKEGGDLR
jgi:hypothetical protein